MLHYELKENVGGPVSMEEVKYFFSYAREDTEFVLKLAKELRAVGVELWLDQLDIFGGQRWDRAIEGALETCQGMIAVLSPESLASNNVMDEVSYALEEGKLIVPLLLRSCTIPFRLRRVQHIDFTADYDTGFSKLLRALHIEQPSRPLESAAHEAAVDQDITAPSKEVPALGTEHLPVTTEPHEPAKQAAQAAEEPLVETPLQHHFSVRSKAGMVETSDVQSKQGSNNTDWACALSIFFLIILWASVVAVFVEIESILFSGPLLSVTGVLVAFLGSRSGTRLLSYLFGYSSPVISIFCLLLITGLDWGPQDAQTHISLIALIYGSFISIIGIFQLKELGRTKRAGVGLE